MKIFNVSLEDLDHALTATNEQFGNNIRFDSLRSNERGDRWLVTLTVNSSFGPGGRVSPNGRRIAAACWHAYGTFLDALPPNARYYMSITREWRKPGDPWVDWNIGSVVNPIMYSEDCDCD